MSNFERFQLLADPYVNYHQHIQHSKLLYVSIDPKFDNFTIINVFHQIITFLLVPEVKMSILLFTLQFVMLRLFIFRSMILVLDKLIKISIFTLIFDALVIVFDRNNAYLIKSTETQCNHSNNNGINVIPNEFCGINRESFGSQFSLFAVFHIIMSISYAACTNTILQLRSTLAVTLLIDVTYCDIQEVRDICCLLYYSFAFVAFFEFVNV